MAEQNLEQSIFLQAIGLAAPADRVAYLDEACRDNPRLRADLDALVAAHDRLGGAPQSPLQPKPTVAYIPPTETAGTVIGPYKLLEQIGEGGMGTVWMAQQTEPVRRVVALKLIKAGMDSKQVIARFEAERQALALMDHPNIAKVLDGGTVGSEPRPLGSEGTASLPQGRGSVGRPYFVMELVKGVPITRYCDEHHLTPRQRLELFIPVCQAVQHAHQKGIIHRDLKPSNVLVALYDGKPVPKVIDFGVAKAAGQPLTEKTLVTGFGNIVGTLEYMSPEQAEINQLDIDTRSDIYSLGVLLYELLAGSPPFSRKDLEKAGMLEMLRVIREEEPSKPSTKLSTADGLPTLAANRGTEPAKLTKLVRGELDWIVMRALEKDRSRRYETANGFAMDVQRYLADEPVQACPPSVGYRFRKFARRNKRALASAALLGVMLVAALGAVTGTIGWAVRDREAREQEIAREVARKLTLTEEGVGQALDQAAKTRAELQGLLQKPGGVQALLNQPGRWEVHVKTAQAELGQAKAIASGSLSAEWTGRIQKLEQELASDEADHRLALRLEKVRLDRATWLAGEGGFDLAVVLREYPRAFADAGLILELGQEQETATRLAMSPIKEELLAALEDWARVAYSIQQDDLSSRLLAVARLADPDPWRDQVRDPALWKDRQAFLKLAEQARNDSGRFSRLTPQMLILIGWLLPDKKAEEMWLRKAQALHPADFWINYSLAVYLQNTKGRPHEAIGYYRAALAIRPQSTAVYNNLGNSLSEYKDLPGAIDAYKKALAIDPQFGLAWNNLGIALRVQGDVSGAVAAYRKALAIDPRYASAWRSLGFALRQQKNLPAAIDAYKKALAIDPRDVNAWINLGNALREQKDLAEAIAAYSKAIELKPDDAMAWCNRGSAYSYLRQFDKALADLSKAIELKPDLVEAWYNRGNAYRDLCHYDNAVAAFSKAIEIDPRFVAAHRNLGSILRHHKQNYAGAITAYEVAIQLQPNFTAAHFDLAAALAQAKQWDRSAAVYAEALKRFGTPLWPGPWYEAIRSDEVFTRLTALHPDDRLPWIMRARLHALQRDWKRAAADYARVKDALANGDDVEFLRRQFDDRFGHAFLLLLLEDRPGYEQFCKTCVDRPVRAKDKAWEYSLTRACAVSPRSVVPSRQLVEWARAVVQVDQGSWCLHALSLAHYRHGEFNLAIELAKESNAGTWRGGGKALNWLVLAMAHSRLGHAAEARTSLEQARQLASRASPEQPPGVEWPDMAPMDLLAFELLRREAEQLIDPKSSEKPDKDKR